MKKKRNISLTDDQLSRLNHLRDRAGTDALTKEQAEEFLSKTTQEVYRMTMDRIGN